METKKARLYYLDILRILAIFAVIIIHVASQSLYYTSPVKSNTWLGLSMWDSLVRWSVPVFVMISGVLFLNPERPFDFQRLLKKNVLHLVEITLIWHVIYALYTFFFENQSKANFVSLLIKGYTHFWFLHMIIGLYLIVPILRKITVDKFLTKYLLLISFVTAIIIPTILNFYQSMAKVVSFPIVISTVMDSLISLVNSFHFQFPMGFLVYFLAGYWLSTLKFNQKGRYTIYGLGLFSALVTTIGTYLFSIKFNTRETPLFDYMNLNIFLIAISIFIFFKYLIPRFKVETKPQLADNILTLSKLTFGIYLVHFMLVHILDRFVHVYDWIPNTFISVPVISVVVFILSGIISLILAKIPWVKNHLI